MTKGWIDADASLNRANPLVHPTQGHEMQRFWHLVKLRIALAENVRKKGVDDLNQFLADVMPARFVQEAPLGGNETHVLPMMAAFGRRWRRRVVLRLLKIEEVGNSSSGGT